MNTMQQERHKPLFIVGMSRSGTSYLHALINLHPAIRLSYEGRIPTEGYHLYNQMKPITSQEKFDDFLDKLILLDESEHQNRWIGQGITPTARHTMFQDNQKGGDYQSIVENLYLLPGDVEYWGNKMLRVEMLPSILELWPQSKFLVLMRDPRAVYASQKKFFSFRRLKSLSIYYNLHSQWVKEHCVDPSTYHLVKYEEFVSDPVTQLGNLLNFLSLSDEQTIDDLLTQKSASTASLDKWRNELTEKEVSQLESYCFDSMIEYGYKPEYANKHVTLTTWTKVTELFLENLHRIPLNPAQWYRKNLLRRLWIAIRR